jgi:hypothetical protein
VFNNDQNLFEKLDFICSTSCRIEIEKGEKSVVPNVKIRIKRL